MRCTHYKIDVRISLYGEKSSANLSETVNRLLRVSPKKLKIYTTIGTIGSMFHRHPTSSGLKDHLTRAVNEFQPRLDETNPYQPAQSACHAVRKNKSVESIFGRFHTQQRIEVDAISEMDATAFTAFNQ